MSDENVGGLVELPKPIRAMVRFTALQHIERDVYTAEQLHAYADARVEAALSAQGQPVVDERINRAWKLVERWEQPTIDGDTLTKEERLRNMGFAAMLRAALGDTP